MLLLHVDSNRGRYQITAPPPPLPQLMLTPPAPPPSAQSWETVSSTRELQLLSTWQQIWPPQLHQHCLTFSATVPSSTDRVHSDNVDQMHTYSAVKTSLCLAWLANKRIQVVIPMHSIWPPSLTSNLWPFLLSGFDSFSWRQKECG